MYRDRLVDIFYPDNGESSYWFKKSAEQGVAFASKKMKDAYKIDY